MTSQLANVLFAATLRAEVVRADDRLPGEQRRQLAHLIDLLHQAADLLASSGPSAGGELLDWTHPDRPALGRRGSGVQ